MATKSTEVGGGGSNKASKQSTRPKSPTNSISSTITLGDTLHRCQRRVNRVASNLFSHPLHLISVNPFVNHWTASKCETVRKYTIGVLMVAIRIIPFIFCFVLSCLMAKLFLGVIAILNRLQRPSDPFRIHARNICFFLMRSGFFFAGFYWIRVVDKRKDRTRLAPIIPVAPHSSFFDVIMILKLKRPTFVSKSENEQAFLIGNLLRLCNGIYVNRSDKDSRVATINAIKNRANNGEHILIFPEGTCANRSALLQFKLGAFIPKLPVQPIIVRWDAGEQDSVTWSWEGPGPVRVFLHAMTRISTNCEITILPQYVPNIEEKQNAKIFAENVSRLMCVDLGVLQSFYSYDDVPIMPIARAVGLFRSPACIMMLKMCQKLIQILSKSGATAANTNNTDTKHAIRSNKDSVNSNDNKSNSSKSSNQQPTSKGSVNSKQATTITAIPFGPKLATITNFMGVGEDVEHHSNTTEVYVPKNYCLQRENSFETFSKKFRELLIGKTKSTAPNNIDPEFDYLPISGSRRRHYKTPEQIPQFPELPKEKRPWIEKFVMLIQHCLLTLEQNFVHRPIESSDDLINLLDLETFVGNSNALQSFRSSLVFVDLVKIIEFNIPTMLTTAHLLIVLHLCDLRENSWERIRVSMQLFQMIHLSAEQQSLAQIGNVANPNINLQELRSLLWYALGLQEFNDQFFIQNDFDFEFLRENLPQLFRRAVNENSPQLVLENP